MLKLVLLGPPGVGKGTQAVRICKSFNLAHISTGDMLRAEIAEGTDIGKSVVDRLHRGELASDEIIISMVRKRITLPDAANGFVFDGFPRTVAQAEALTGILDIDWVINLEADYQILLDRITSRRTCIVCKAVFKADEVPSGVCKNCGHKLYIRDDDRPETFANRYSVYTRQTEPIIGYYAKLGKLLRIDGTGSMDEVFSTCERALKAGVTER